MSRLAGRGASSADAPLSRSAARVLGAGVIALTIVLAAPGAALARTAAAAKTASPAKTKAAALPAAGDWEGTGTGNTTASFEVAHASTPASTKGAKSARSAKGAHKAPATTYAVVEDFAVDAPISCSNASQPAIPFDVEVVTGPLRLGKNGTFSSGAIKGGAGTVVSGRFKGTRFTVSYRHVSQTPNQFAGGTEVCDTGTIHITAVRGHRRLVKDGIWQGETQTNEPVVFYVVAGGRALEAPPHAPTNGSPQAAFAFGQFTQTCFTGGCTTSSDDICAYESATSLFVAAGGGFSNSQWQDGGDDPIVAGTFTSAGQASGQFANGPEACGQTDWSAEAG
jgi:hypothetical protein